MQSDCFDAVRELEAAGVDDGLRLWWFGGTSYALKSAHSVVYVDPFYSVRHDDDPHGFVRAIPNYLPPGAITRADLVLSTHEHADHCDPASLGPIAEQTEALFAVAASSAGHMRGWGIDAGRIQALAPGDVVTHRDVTLTALAARDAGDRQAVTFVLQAAGKAVFIGGDTLYTEEFAAVGRRFRIDLAVLALGRNRFDLVNHPMYLMPEDVARTALALGAGRVLPIHWDLWEAWREDPRLVAPHLHGTAAELVILAQGESLQV